MPLSMKKIVLNRIHTKVHKYLNRYSWVGSGISAGLELNITISNE